MVCTYQTNCMSCHLCILVINKIVKMLIDGVNFHHTPLLVLAKLRHIAFSQSMA